MFTLRVRNAQEGLASTDQTRFYNMPHKTNSNKYDPIQLQVYYPGETVSGAIEFTLTKPKYYDCIKVEFLGKAHVQWSRGKTHYVGNEKYIEDRILLWSPQQSGGSIGPGSFSFRFQFVIPSHVPSSFAYENTSIFDNGSAYISYKVEGRAVTGVFRFDDIASAEIFILQLMSINGEQMVPVRQVKRKQVGCLCCAAGDVEFVVKLPRTGYCVINRDIIPLKVDVQNNSTRVIEMNAKIMKRVTLFVRDHDNISWEDVAEISSDSISAGASCVWNPTNWFVPEVRPTLVGCRIIHVDYILRVSAVIPNALNLTCDIPLFLSNLPYRSSGDRALLEAIITALLQGATANRLTNDDDVYDPNNSSERDTLI